MQPVNPLADLTLDNVERAAFFSQGLNAFVVTRFEDCLQVLKDPATFSSSPFDSPALMANFASRYRPIYERAGVPPFIPALVTTDGSVHHRYRAAVDRSFTVSSVRALESKIDMLVDTLIDAFIDDGTVDLYAEFCMKLPLFVICDMVGLPREQAPLLRRSADAMARLAGGVAEDENTRIGLHEDQAAFHLYLLPLIARLRAAPDDTLLSCLIHTPTEDGSLLNDAEIVSIVTTLNVGGNETTTNGLGSMFRRCFEDKAMQEKLRSDRGLIDRFVEEVLRLETPVAAMPRFVYHDTMIGDVAVPAGSALLVSFHCANHDSARFACPEALDTQRSGARNHLAFGMGPHFCLGASLSRVELAASLNRVLDRMGNIRLDTTDGPLPTQHKVTVRGVTALPIRFDRLG